MHKISLNSLQSLEEHKTNDDPRHFDFHHRNIRDVYCNQQNVFEYPSPRNIHSISFVNDKAANISDAAKQRIVLSAQHSLCAHSTQNLDAMLYYERFTHTAHRNNSRQGTWTNSEPLALRIILVVESCRRRETHDTIYVGWIREPNLFGTNSW